MKTPRTVKALFLTLLAVITLLPSCTAADPIISIGDTPVDGGVYAYFLSRAIDENSDKTAPDIIVAAAQGVRYYVKVNTSAAKVGIVLSEREKVELSERLSGFWAVYGEYYGKIGVSKETVRKVFESEAYETALLEANYGKGGVKEVAQSDILACLNKYFIVFKSVNGYFTETKEDGRTYELSELERELLTAEYKKTAKRINDGELTIEEAASRLRENDAGYAPETVILKKGSPYYSDSFFEQAAEAKADTATVVVTDKNVFLIIKEKIEADGDYFKDNYIYALKKLKGDEMRSLILSENTYQAEVSQSKAESMYNRIIKVREERE